MDANKMDERIEGVQFSPIFREDTLGDFKDICKDNYKDFLKLFFLSKDINDYLESKRKEGDNSSKEYFTRLFNIRIRDHFSSSFILISQGFIVDAISLTRSSLEDLLVIINFYINKKFFNQWYENKEEFKVVVGNLRQNVKNSSIFEKEDGEFFDNVYGALSNIVHPKLNSVRLMSTYHPSFNNLDAINLKKYTDLIILSYYTYEIQICNFLENIYPDDKEKLKLIKQTLNDDISIKSLINLEK
ncbi:hypothetical protein [Peribacillus frigoritolerans]|uniref:hypothetical protein n=1 Tax=Peribacillus frigoritolerans TaxID=450367 RepID=UPI002EBA7A18|nr:hypothetical protein [Peribacillus frigoritolerans]